MPRPRKGGPSGPIDPGPHIYWRERGGKPRAYGDFRSVGGTKEALRPPGQKRATSDPDLARVLFDQRLSELTRAQRWGTQLAPRDADLTGLAAAVVEFIRYLRQETGDDPNWIGAAEQMLGRAVEYFGAERPLAGIDRAAVRSYIRFLREVHHARGRGLKDLTIRHHLNALSRLYGYAPERGWVAEGYNPVHALKRKERPGGYKPEEFYLTNAEAARLLEAARTYPVEGNEFMRLAYPVLAVLLLAGPRMDECRGMELVDVDFMAGSVRFRDTKYRRGRRGKTTKADRLVPLWPQLRGALEEYLHGGFRDELRLRFEAQGIETTLLFPHPDTGRPIVDFRPMIDRCAARAGLPVGKIRSRVTRRTYATARSMTLWAGYPVPEFVVIEEMGHSDSKMLRLCYRKVARSPHRSEVVEYRLPNGSIHGSNREPSPPVVARHSEEEGKGNP